MKLWMFIVLFVVASNSFGGEIADLHKKLVGDEKPNRQNFRDWGEEQKHGVTEIGLERTECFGDCPVYTVVMKSDGTFRYHGKKYVQRKGNHMGKINLWNFNLLAQYIKDCEYLKFDNTYRAGVTDMPTVYTTVVMDGKRKVIEDYASAGPTKLWAVEQLIDKLLLEAEWDGEKSATDEQTKTPMTPSTQPHSK